MTILSTQTTTGGTAQEKQSCTDNSIAREQTSTLMSPAVETGRGNPAADCNVQWLVGFRFWTADGQQVRHYYRVAGASGDEHAKRLAMERACQQGPHPSISVDGSWSEVCVLHRNALGIWDLAE